MIKTGLIGHPVAHSQSPHIHGHWIKKYQLNADYIVHDVPLDKIESQIQFLVDHGYAGFNITVPHKQKIMDFCDDIDDLACAVGAVNTVSIHEGKLYGTNTDVFGFIENIEQNSNGIDFLSGPAVVLGAGGAARAAIYALLQAGVSKIRILNRTVEKAQCIKSDFDSYGDIGVYDWDVRASILSDSVLLVNTTSLGMTGKPSLEISLNNLPVNSVVCDIVYAPLYTDLLCQARERGNHIVTGIGMLLHQARPAFKAWHGIMPNVDSLLESKILK